MMRKPKPRPGRGERSMKLGHGLTGGRRDIVESGTVECKRF
jgi:hypothetical protein